MPNFDPNETDKLRVIESTFRVKIFVWSHPSSKSKWNCIRRPQVMLSDNFDSFIDVVIDRDESNTTAFTLINCGLILNVDETIPAQKRVQRSRFTIFEALAILKNPNLKSGISKLRESVKELESVWGRKTVHCADAREFYKIFKASLQIWITTEDRKKGLKRDKVFDQAGFPNLIGSFQKIRIQKSFESVFFI